MQSVFGTAMSSISETVLQMVWTAFEVALDYVVPIMAILLAWGLFKAIVYSVNRDNPDGEETDGKTLREYAADVGGYFVEHDLFAGDSDEDIELSDEQVRELYEELGFDNDDHSGSSGSDSYWN